MDRETTALRARLVAEVQRLNLEIRRLGVEMGRIQQQIDEIDRVARERSEQRTAALRANFEALLRRPMTLTDENVRTRNVALSEFVGLCQNYDDVYALYHVVENFLNEQPDYVNHNDYLGELHGFIESMFFFFPPPPPLAYTKT
jgi:hypothetical protein